MPQPASPFLVWAMHGCQLLEQEREIVDCKVGADGARFLGTFEQPHVELLGPF